MGVSYADFWSMNPHIINIISRGYQEKMKMQDSQMWFMGMYVHSAVSVAVERAIVGKKSKSEYIEKPILSGLFDNYGLTEEEIIQKEIQKAILFEEKSATISVLPKTVIKQ